MQPTYIEVTEERADASRVGRAPREQRQERVLGYERGRLRGVFTIDAGMVTMFVVQLEAWHEEGWRPVCRYDTAHGRPHVDVMDIRGRLREKLWLDVPNSEALTLALSEINSNWE
jgi:hypothetical protein